MYSYSEWWILLCVVIATRGLLASETDPQTAQGALEHSDTTLQFRSSNVNLETGSKDDAVYIQGEPASESLQQTKMIERRMDHHGVTHGVGYSTHLDPQYYQGKHMGKYYDCARQGPWKPIQGNYPERAPSADGGRPQSIIQHHHVHHNHPPTNHHHDQHSGPEHHVGNSFGTNYVEEWDQRLKEVLRGTPVVNHGSSGHRGVAIDAGHLHHGGGPEFGSVSGGYKVASSDFGGSGSGSPYNVWEDHPEDHHAVDIVHGHRNGVKGGKGSPSFQADFPYQFDSAKLPEWINGQPYDGSASNEEPHEGFVQDSVQGGEEYPALKAFNEAVKNIGDIRYTHAMFGLVDPESHEGEEHREGAASQGYQGDAEEGHREGGDGDYHHQGSNEASSSEEEEPNGGGGLPQGHAAPARGAGAFRTGEGYAVEEVQDDEGVEQSNPSGEYTSSGTGEGVETNGDFNSGGSHGDFNAPNTVDQHQPQPTLQSTQSGIPYGGGNDVQVVTNPYREGVIDDGGGPHTHAAAGMHQYEAPPPRCPYAHDPALHHQAVSVSNVIHSLPYDEGVQASHLQVMMPPRLQHHVKLGSVLPFNQYEVHENQEESENKETVVDGLGRPNRIPSGPHGYHGGERPLSDADGMPILQHGHAGEAFAEANKVVDGSGLPSKPEDGDDFLRPPPLFVTGHYMKGNGNFKGFSDGRRKRRPPVGRPSSHSGMPHAALYKRPPPLMMRARPVIRGPVKRLSYA